MSNIFLGKPAQCNSQFYNEFCWKINENTRHRFSGNETGVRKLVFRDRNVFGSVRNAHLALLVTLTSGNINNDYNMAFSETCRNLTNKFICQRDGCSENNNIQSLEVLIPEVSTAHNSISFSETTLRSFLSPRLIHSRKHWTMTMMFLCCHARPRGFRRIPEGHGP